MRWNWVAGLVLGALVLSPSAADAFVRSSSDAKVVLSLTESYTASPWSQQTGYANRAYGKLRFGLKNVLVGWVDLFTVPREALDAGDNVLIGIGRGVKEAVENTLGGAVHLATFPITNLDAPLPGGGTQLFSSF